MKNLFSGQRRMLFRLILIPVVFGFFGFGCNNAFAYSSISMSVDSNSLVLGLLPSSANGNFSSSSDVNIHVELDGPGGYTLGINAKYEGDDETRLVRVSDSTSYFSSITSAITAANYTSDAYATANNLNNTWGYLPSKYNSADNTNYRPAPTANGDILDATNGTDEIGEYTISIGARADLTTKPGTYRNTYVITAVANIACNPLATNISEALCMQDMNDSVINSMVTNKQYRLADNRDWKRYYVAKMKDGRVWMTQNLDLDLETTATNVAALTSLNTDLNTFGTDNYDTNNDYACSNPSTTTNCTANGEFITWTPGSATLASNAYNSWTISDTAPSSFDYGEQYRYVSTTGTTNTFNSTSSCESAHPDGTCPHYHVGNYYNWSAAVASNSTSGLTTNFKIMDNSICPAGWRLPISRTSTDPANGGYYAEVNFTLKEEGIITNYIGSGTATYTTGGWNSLRNSPLYVMAAGYKNGASLPSSVGDYARFWTPVIYNSANAYIINAYSSSVNVSSNYARATGISVRCVARQENTGHTTITYDKNASDATGTTANQTIYANTFGNISNNGYTRSGYAFNSWNTEPDGTGIAYNEGDQFYAITGTAVTNVTLYAQWDKLYTITFSLAGNATKVIFDGTEYTNGQTAQAVEGRTYTIAGDYATKHGFYSWSATAGTFAAQQPVTTYTTPTSNATITLTGQEATINMSTLPTSSDPVSSNCKNEAITPILVYDPRDNEAYWVARLCDGNYWMLDNLRLDLTNSTVISSLSESNTNASNTALGYLKNGGGTASNQWPTSGLTGSNWTTSNSYTEPLVNVSGSVTAGTNQNTWTGNYTKETIAPVTYGLGSGKIGVYYNFCAASAGTYCYDYGYGAQNTTINPIARDIEGDICPKGWRMPTGGVVDTTTGGGEYANLGNKYYGGGTIGGPINLTQHLAAITSLSMPLSGMRTSGGTSSYVGNYGSAWSSTRSSHDSMYHLSISPNGYTNGNSSRYAGIPVRCIYSDQTSVIVNFDGGVQSVTFTGTDSPSQVTVSTSGTTINLGNGKTYSITVVNTARYATTGWSTTAGTPTSDSRAPATYTVAGDATITISSTQATTDMTSLTASSDPVSSNCKNEAVNLILVYDPRDGEAYWVARLCDGNYWMLDNLRLDLTNATIVNNLSTSNTNADADSLTSLKSGNRTLDNKYATAGLELTNWASSYSYSVPKVKVSGSVTAGTNSNTWTGNYTKDTIAPVTYGLGSGKIGVYYNYCAASAGSYCYGSGTSTTGSPSSDPNTTTSPTARDITSDICPVGWRMATSGSYSTTTGGGDYQNLYSKYSGNSTLGGETSMAQHLTFKTALSTPLSGYFNNASAYYQGSYGYFWSSTWYGTNSMYGLSVNSTNVSPSSTSNRSNGLTVRCLLGS